MRQGPDNIPAMLDEALRRCQAGELAQAERIYRRILAADAEVPDAWNMLALVLYQGDRLDEAATAAERATTLRPQIPPYWLTRGNIAMACHRDQEAQASFGRAIGLHPDFAEAHFCLGLIHRRGNRIPEAIASFRSALARAPDVAEIHYQLGEALGREARWDEAMRSYEQALARDRDNVLDHRECLECLRHLRFETLPGFWDAALRRFFARDDLEEDRFTDLGLRALMTKGAFRAAVGAASREGTDFDPDSAAVQEVMGDAMFRRLLQDALIADPGFECLLTRLRSALLADEGLRARTALEFLCALALQCFNNEHVLAESPAESALVARLQADVETGLEAEPGAASQWLRPAVVLAMYRPLHSVRGAAVLEDPGQNAAVMKLWRRSVRNARDEQRLRQDIAAIAPISDSVSRAVRDQYEEHPYPRWFSLDRSLPAVPVADWLESAVPMLKGRNEWPSAVRVLVAGCGTGRQAISTACRIAGAKVLAVDLSLASLAYGRRMANELGVGGVEFRHGDILELSALPERFDMIFCSGVLHHLRDPQSGLRVLAGLLRPGGLLNLGLYSARARAGVNVARQAIRERALEPTATAIREFRQLVLKAGPDSPLKRLADNRDFYAMSSCRDFLFHVQEHQFDPLQIGAMLREAGLTMLGVANDAPRAALMAYRRMFPGDDWLADFRQLDAFEAQYPDTFIGMFQFWCQSAISTENIDGHR